MTHTALLSPEAFADIREKQSGTSDVEGGRHFFGALLDSDMHRPASLHKCTYVWAYMHVRVFPQLIRE